MDYISNISGGSSGVSYTPATLLDRAAGSKSERLAGSSPDEAPDTLTLGQDNDSGTSGAYTRNDIISKLAGDVAKSDDAKAVQKKLEDRDSEVRRHELTHAVALGSYAVGSPQYSFETGPDGKQYAVGGSIAVDVGSTGNAARDKTKAMVIQMAALAVDHPSAADLAVSSQVQELSLNAKRKQG